MIFSIIWYSQNGLWLFHEYDFSKFQSVFFKHVKYDFNVKYESNVQFGHTTMILHVQHDVNYLISTFEKKNEKRNPLLIPLTAEFWLIWAAYECHVF